MSNAPNQTDMADTITAEEGEWRKVAIGHGHTIAHLKNQAKDLEIKLKLLRADYAANVVQSVYEVLYVNGTSGRSERVSTHASFDTAKDTAQDAALAACASDDDHVRDVELLHGDLVGFGVGMHTYLVRSIDVEP